MRKITSHSTTLLSSFNQVFLEQIKQSSPLVNPEHLKRSIRAAQLLSEHTRLQFERPDLPHSREKLGDYARRMLALEIFAQPKLCKVVRKEEEKLIDFASKQLKREGLGMHVIEIALVFKASIFRPIREKADVLMNECTSRVIRST